MNVRAVFCAVSFLVGAVSASAGQIEWPGAEGLLVDHQPQNTAGLASDTLFSETPGGVPFPWQLVADDFSIASASPIRRIVFWGWYNFNVPPTTEETIRLRFYDVRPGDGLPGDVLFEQSFVNVQRTWTGRNVIAAGGGPELRFEVLLDEAFYAEASTAYWFEVSQIGDLESAFRWEISGTPVLNGQAVSNPNYPDWLQTAPALISNTAFQLYSIPEPASLSLLIVGTITLGFSRRRRRQSPSGEVPWE